MPNKIGETTLPRSGFWRFLLNYLYFDIKLSFNLNFKRLISIKTLLPIFVAVLLILMAWLPKARLEKFKNRTSAFFLRLLGKFTLMLVRSFIKTYQWIQKKGHKEPDFITPLTAVINEENFELYNKALQDGLTHSAVRNIALTGPYGSGKSSIINTFFYKNPHYYPIFISLATFKDSKKNEDESQYNTVEEEENIRPKSEKQIQTAADEQEKISKKIEFSILQQLLYHVHSGEMPFSRFKRIHPISITENVAFLISGPLLALSFLYSKYKNWKILADAAELKWPNMLSLDFVSIMILLFGFIAVIYYVIRVFRIGLIKLNLQGAEVELSKENKLSILNEHMDEILYFFASTRFDILVVEDLDRFRDPEIFVKLREINTLLNNSKQITRKITFLYALRDDLFADESRTKFFDLILPVIPVTNASNSASKLITTFAELNLKKPISESFLSDLSLFLTDGRLITNIVNEFKIYRKQLNITDLDNAKLLSLIVYKNIHPADFTLLQENKGMLYDLFQLKDSIKKELIEDLESEANELKANIGLIERNFYSSMKELRLVYLAILYKNIYERDAYFSGQLYVNNDYRNLDDLTKDSLFSFIKSSHTITFHRTNGGTTNIRDEFSKVEKLVDDKRSYDEREVDLVKLFDFDKNQAKDRLSEVGREISRIRGYTFYELLKLKSLDRITTEINKDTRLTFLVRNGYINEDYSYYLSYFKPGQLGKSDVEYILAVKNERALEWQHKLEKTAIVADRVTEAECSSWTVMNFELVSYLLSSGNNSEKLKLISNQLAKLESEHFSFIQQYKQNKPETFGLLIAGIIKRTNKFWRTVSHDNLLSQTEVTEYLVSLIKFGEIEDIKNQDIDRVLSNTIAHEKDIFLLGDGCIIDRLSILLDDLRIKIALPPATRLHSKNLRDIVLKKHHFELNQAMIEFMIASSNVTDNLIGFNKGQFTNILETPELADLASYIRQNLGIYVDDVYLKYENHERESVEGTIEILNSSDVLQESKEKVIASTRFELTSLDDVAHDLWNALIDYDRIKPSWRNVSSYERNFQISSVLISWLEKDRVNWMLGEEKVRETSTYHNEAENSGLNFQDVIIKLLETPGLAQSVKLRLSKAILFEIDTLDFTNIGMEPAGEILPQVKYSKRVALSLKRSLFELFVKYIQNHWEQLVSDVDHLDLDGDDLIGILKSDLTNEQREFFYTKLNPSLLSSLFNERIPFPGSVFYLPNMKMDDTQIASLNGTLTEDDTVDIIIGNIQTISEDTIAVLLQRLGSPFVKIARRVGKEVTKSKNIEKLVEALSNNKKIVASFDPKSVIIEIQYFKNQ